MNEPRSLPCTRRDFLTAAGGALAAAGLASADADPPGDKADAPNPAVGKPVSDTAEAQGGTPKVPGPPPKRLGYAVVGLGKLALGEVLPAFALTERCRPAALVSGDRDKARAVADHYGIDPKSIYDYKDFDAIRDNPAVDVVYVILPNALHEEFTVRAAGAGKHVLCEKPMATTVEACQAMIAACDKAGRKLMIAYRVHYEPYNQKMIEMCRQQVYGPIQFIVSDTLMEVGGAKQWRLDPKLSGGGSLVDIGIYSLNATRYLTGEEPAEINAIQWSNPKDAALQGPGGEHRVPAALPRRRAGQLHVELRHGRRRQPLPRHGGGGVVRPGAGHRLPRPADAAQPRRRRGRAGGFAAGQPFRLGNGPFRAMRGREPPAEHAGRGGDAGRETDPADLRGGPQRQDGEGVGGSSAGLSHKRRPHGWKRRSGRGA